MMNWVKHLRDIVFVWGTLVAATTAVLAYYEQCEDCFMMYSVEFLLGALTIVTSMVIWVTFQHRVERIDTKVTEGLVSVHITLLKADVDRFYNAHKDSDTLTEDDMKYVYMLKEKLEYYKVNSFTQRKVDSLLAKEIV